MPEQAAPQKKRLGAREKLAALWTDKRSYPKRFLLALIVSFAAAFTFLFFGPVEITASSASSLNFTLASVTPVLAGVCAVSTVVLAAVLALLRGKIFNYLVTGVFSLTLCGYIQGNILNGSLGALTGDAILWQTKKASLLINLLVWLVVFLIPYLVLYLSRKIWKNALRFVSLALVVMQGVALITIAAGGAFSATKEQHNILTTDNMFTYSSKSNTLIFVLDRLDYDFIEEILSVDEDFFSPLTGFTQYTNAISELARTKPAINYMLTGRDDLIYQIPQEEYFEKSWENGEKNILRDLHNKDFQVDIYTEISSMLGRGDSTRDYVDNLQAQNAKLNYPGVVEQLAYLSAYRYAPVALKPFFWCYTDDVNKGSFYNSKEYILDEVSYKHGIDRFETRDSAGAFKFYHFNGSHPPYYVDENGEHDSRGTSSYAQTKGNFRILFEAFSKMKEMGIYENTSIIITADHGDPVADDIPVQKATRIGFFYKPAGASEEPLQLSNAPVSLRNIPATVAKSAGLEYEKYGVPIDEVPQDAMVVRTFYKSVMDGSHEKELHVYDVIGDAGNFENWRCNEIRPIPNPYY